MKIFKILPVVVFSFFFLFLTKVEATYSNGVLDSTFGIGNGLGGEYNPSVFDFEILDSGKILIGGNFTSYGVVERSYIARLNTDGSLDTEFSQVGDGLNGEVRAIAIQDDGKIIVGGAFTAYNYESRSRIARLNEDGSLDSSFTETGTGLNGSVTDIVIQDDGKIIVVGSFTLYNGTGRSRIARLNSDGSLDTSFTPGTGIGGIAYPYVYKVTLQDDGKILVGGVFLTYAGTSRPGIVRLNSDGTLDTTFDPGTGVSIASGEYISDIVVQEDGKILVAGFFSSFNGQGRANIARLNSDGSLDTGFVQTGTGINSTVNSIKIQNDSKILVGGAFTSYNGVKRDGILRLNSDGTLDSSFSQIGTGLNSNVVGIGIQSDGNVIISGSFTSYNGLHIQQLARLGSGDLSINLSPIVEPISGFPEISGGSIYAMALSEDRTILYIAGSFSEVDGVARDNLAAINLSTYEVTQWSPSTDGTVYAIAVEGDNIYIGGDFWYVNETYTGEFAIINTQGVLNSTCIPDIHSYQGYSVESIKLTDNYIYVGGGFEYIGTEENEQSVTGLLRLGKDANCTFDQSWIPELYSDSESPTVYTMDEYDGSIYIGGDIDSINGFTTGELAKFNPDGTLDTENCTPNIYTYFDNLVPSTIYSIKATDEYIYVGGSFNRVGNESNEVDGLIRLINSSSCTWDDSWLPSPNGSTRSITISNSDVYIGGTFNMVDDQVSEFIKLDSISGLPDSTWNPEVHTTNISMSVYSTLLGDNELYIGGSFTGIEDYDIYGLAAFNIDTTGPQGSISINLGKEYTISQSVTLTLTAVDNSSGVDQMMICNDPSFTDCTWETYSTTKAWTLDSTLGSKSVYVKFKDKAGNISSVYTDSIILHTPSVRITEIGLVKDLADKSPLTVYFTSVTPLVKGVTQSGSTVYFVYDGKTYSTVADSNGNFSISLTVSQGTNTIQYYSNDISSNQSITKTLNLIVGTQYFPESLLINMGLMTPTQEQEETTKEEDTPDTPEEDNEQEEEPIQEESSIQTLQFTDKEGNPLVNAYVTIDGQEYYTDKNGEIQVPGLEKEKKYKVKVEINGIKYTSEVLGASGEDGSIKVTITEGDISNGIEWKKIFIYSGIGLVGIFFLIIIFRKRKDKEEELK